VGDGDPHVEVARREAFGAVKTGPTGRATPIRIPVSSSMRVPTTQSPASGRVAVFPGSTPRSTSTVSSAGSGA
jgi:hypothetical protein